jgi:hypothetical protein
MMNMKYAVALSAILLMILASAGLYLLFFASAEGDDATTDPATSPVPTLSTDIPPLDIHLTPWEATRIEEALYLFVHPIRDSVLTVDEYNRGEFRENYDTHTIRRYNICLDTEVIMQPNFFCNLPPSELMTATPNATCMARVALNGTDYRSNFRITLDRTVINGGVLGDDNTLEHFDDHDGYSLCYHIPLEPGVHTVRYEFAIPSANIEDQAEWSFTLTP